MSINVIGRRRPRSRTIEHQVLCTLCDRACIGTVSGKQSAATPATANVLLRQAALRHLAEKHGGHTHGVAQPFEVLRFDRA
jgi:hypothetical protein